ncbi:MAG TPA: ABC transporter permease [Thermomicrobiales bacterium]|mgnify:CR=1 FL=1|nr:ABC transporter permease [Thermomicrobiales bacterium]
MRIQATLLVIQYIIRRVLLLIPILFGVSLITFILVRSIPGDPASVAIGVDQRITPEQRALVRKSYGLDESKPVQYVKWMKHVVRGDLGYSLRTKRPVITELKLRLPVTVELALWAGFLGIGPALAVGVLAALKRNSAADYFATIITLLGISAPGFLIAVLLILLFSYQLKWLPPVGFVRFTDSPWGNIKGMIMPAISLALPFAAVMMRNTRSAVLEVIGQDYVRVARAKGMSQPTVLMRHIMPNASLPILTIAGIQVAGLLGGTVIIEQIFGLPGLGRYIFDAIRNRDYPVVQGVTLVIATMFVLVSLMVDILYAVVDPRLRRS